jgi:hypothetical protein
MAQPTMSSRRHLFDEWAQSPAAPQFPSAHEEHEAEQAFEAGWNAREGKRFLHAYRVSDVDMPLVPAPAEREWMSDPYVAAERCLPIVMANQSGWLLLSAHCFTAHWNGGPKASDIEITYADGPEPYPAESVFGQGIITFRPPYLFRTSPGYNLLVRGPANYPSDGACPLEGLVETDWTFATFTVNWQLTQSLPFVQSVRVHVGDPIAMLVPQRRSELEQFETRILELDADPAVAEEYRAYRDSRAQFKSDRLTPGTRAQERGWERHYYQGRTVLGQKAPEHQTRRHLQGFDVSEG